MTEASFLRYALPSSDWITQDLGCRTSVVSIKAVAPDYPSGLAITGVYLNGARMRHRVLDPLTVAVEPMLRLQGDRVEVRFLAPDTAPEATTGVPRYVGSPNERYGLQPPISPHRKPYA
jgi:hypothetical protein